MSILLDTRKTDNKTIIPDMDNDDYDSLPEEWPVRTHMLAGAAAGILEHATMYPIDCVKTQMQSIVAVRYNGVYNALSTIIMKDGVRRLLRGMSAMVIGAGPAHAMYFACYEKVKHHITVHISGKNGKNSSIANGLAGASATIFHDIVMNPAEVVKQRMQMHGSSHRSTLHCVTSTLRSEGILAFYRSFPTQLLMNIPFQSVHFVVYELSQEKINSNRTYNPLSHVASGAAAGACAAFITNPLDVCRTLLNTQEMKHSDKKMVVPGLRVALLTIFRTDGFRTFYRGVTARVLYQMPSTAISWSIYELFKHLLYQQKVPKDSDNESFINHQSSTHPRDISFQATPVCAAPSCPGTVLMQYNDTRSA